MSYLRFPFSVSVVVCVELKFPAAVDIQSVYLRIRRQLALIQLFSVRVLSHPQIWAKRLCSVLGRHENGFRRVDQGQNLKASRGLVGILRIQVGLFLQLADQLQGVFDPLVRQRIDGKGIDDLAGGVADVLPRLAR